MTFYITIKGGVYIYSTAGPANAVLLSESDDAVSLSETERSMHAYKLVCIRAVT